MFLQETKTKRGGKTYVSYLVRESFRTPNGPRGRTICNLTHLPKEVRDLVGDALKGKPVIPLEKLELNDVHSFGGCVVLHDAAERFQMQRLLTPLAPRNRSLVQAMIFGGLLFPPSTAPFYIESRSSRLAMFCGLDPKNERFDVADLNAALAELEAKWPQISRNMEAEQQGPIKALALFERSPLPGIKDAAIGLGALAMNVQGLPLSLGVYGGPADGNHAETFLAQPDFKENAPLIVLDETLAERLGEAFIGEHPAMIELSSEALTELWREVGDPDLARQLGTGEAVEVRHGGWRYILAPPVHASAPEAGAELAMGSLQELSTMVAVATTPAAAPSPAPAAREEPASSLPIFHGIRTHLSTAQLSLAEALAWAERSREARRAFSPVYLIVGSSGGGDGAGTWRNHQALQFLTHRLRSQLSQEWAPRGEMRPVEDVLRDLQEVYSVTLAVRGAGVPRQATHISEAAAALVGKLALWHLFGGSEFKS